MPSLLSPRCCPGLGSFCPPRCSWRPHSSQSQALSALSVTFWQGSFVSPSPSASARYKGSILSLQVSFSIFPGLKHRERGGEGGPLSRDTMTGGTLYMDGDVVCAPWSVQLGALAGMCLAGSRPPSLPSMYTALGSSPCGLHGRPDGFLRCSFSCGRCPAGCCQRQALLEASPHATCAQQIQALSASWQGPSLPGRPDSQSPLHRAPREPFVTPHLVHFCQPCLEGAFF